MTGKIVLAEPDVLADRPVGVTVEGCGPGEQVSLVASWEVSGLEARTEARFVVPESGVVDPTELLSVGGTYKGVEPYGLWWSTGLDVARIATDSLEPWTVTLTASGQGWESSESLVRRKMAGSVRRVDVSAGALRGIAFFPDRAPLGSVLLFSGSGGGVSSVQCSASLLASHGFATLALAYFNYPDLPAELVDIPLEYFRTGIDWLVSATGAAAGRVAVMGASRGGELALLLGSTFPDRVSAVVSMVPSGVVWGGLRASSAEPAVAWTLEGNPVVPLQGGAAVQPDQLPRRDGALVVTPMFEALVASAPAEALAAAEIPVERCDGPVLLISGEDDALWPSVALAEIAERRAATRGARHPIRHLRYPDAGHGFTHPAGFPAATSVVHPVTGDLLALGGSLEGNAHASESSWREILGFLRSSATAGGDGR